MKRLAAFLLILCLLIPAAAAESTPLIYRVTDSDGHVLYLFGTIHAGREDLYPLSDAVENAYAASEVLAVEADITEDLDDEAALMEAEQFFMYVDGDKLSNHIDPELVHLLSEALEIPEYMVEWYCPYTYVYGISMAVAMELTELDGYQGVDYTLLRRAHDDGKEIVELEGETYQYTLLRETPDALMEYFLRLMLLPDEYDVEYTEEDLATLLGMVEDYAEELIDGWKTGNPERIAAESAEDPDEYPEELRDAVEEYNRMMLYDRNAAMVDRAEEFLAGGRTVMIAVGTAHIVGEQGVAALLAARGYTVEDIH